MARSTPKLLTESEAAKYLRVTASTHARVRRAGRIAYIKIAQRSYRYTQPMLDEYVRVSRVLPKAWVIEKEKQKRYLEAVERRAGIKNPDSYEDTPFGRAAGSTDSPFGNGILKRPKNF